MLYNINTLSLHCVFHGIRFKVSNEDWLSGDNLFFFYTDLNIIHLLFLLFNRTFKGYRKIILLL